MSKSKFKVVAFVHPEVPADLDIPGRTNEDEVVRRIAREKFGLRDSDFNPAAQGQFGGYTGREGYILCVEVKEEATEEIQGDPAIKHIFDPLPPIKICGLARCYRKTFLHK